LPEALRIQIHSSHFSAFLKYAKIKKLLYKTAKTTGTAAKKLMPGTVRHSFHAPVFGSPRLPNVHRMHCKSGSVRLPQSSGERRLEKKNDLHFCKSLIFKWYHQESNRGHKDFQYKPLKITIVTLSAS